MRKLYKIYVDNQCDDFCFYYKTTATNYIIPNIKRILKSKGLSYNKIELREL